MQVAHEEDLQQDEVVMRVGHHSEEPRRDVDNNGCLSASSALDTD